MRKPYMIVMSMLGMLAIGIGIMPSGVQASSHREAPLISKDPGADNTDLYAFVSPDKPNTVTVVANYIPLEEPNGGPNFNAFDDNVLYEIKVDNNGDGQEDISYQFRFKTTVRNPNTFLYNTGPIGSLNDPNWNMPQTYSVMRVEHGKRRKLGENIPTPPDNIGPRSTPNYEKLAAGAAKELPGGIKVFAGQRDDPFFVDLGSIFDLGGLRPFNNLHLIPLDATRGVDGVSGYNTHSIVMQIPIDQLTRNHTWTKDPKDPNAVIGFYASASRKKIRVLRGDGTEDQFGPWVQVSRLGEPLINEVIIPLGQKDHWNATDPADDRQFLDHYTTPELAGLINLLYPSLPHIPTTNRADLVAVLLTGVPGLNFTGDHKADLLRLNTAIQPSASPSRLGVLDGDLAGFPNGRRLTDDVIDIELRAVACGYGKVLEAGFHLCNLSPNNMIGDGVDANDASFGSSFPYVATPHQGYESTLHLRGW